MTDDEHAQWAQQNGKGVNEETMNEELKQLDTLLKSLE